RCRLEGWCCRRRGRCRRRRRRRRRRWCTDRLSIVESILLGTTTNRYAPVHPCVKVLVGRGTGIVIVTRIGRLDPGVRLRRQRANYIRERLVRQPTHAIVGGTARPHPLTGNGAGNPSGAGDPPGRITNGQTNVPSSAR